MSQVDAHAATARTVYSHPGALEGLIRSIYIQTFGDGGRPGTAVITMTLGARSGKAPGTHKHPVGRDIDGERLSEPVGCRRIIWLDPPLNSLRLFREGAMVAGGTQHAVLGTLGRS